jgi:hypothetical protein
MWQIVQAWLRIRGHHRKTGNADRGWISQT